MRCAFATLVMLFAAMAHGADGAPKATGTLDGKQLKFPEKGVADGVKATVGLLESCHDESLYQADELKKAEKGDHLRLVFPKPITVRQQALVAGSPAPQPPRQVNLSLAECGPFITAAWPFGLTNTGSMSGMEWLYRWEGHEARVAIRRDSQTWEQLYLDGTLSAEQRGWHFFPATLAAKIGDAGGEKHEVRVRVGWGFRCRIWVDSVLTCWAVSGGYPGVSQWFVLQYAGHSVEVSFKEWFLWRRLRLSIDGQVVARTAKKGLPSKLGIAVEGKFKRPDGSVAQVVARAGSINGPGLQVDSALVFHWF